MDLLKTKLQPPRLQGEMVQRPDLIKALDRNRAKKVTIVCAPAGYGKSSVVSEWLKHSSIPSAWLSLDEEDNLLRCFLKYLSAAIENILPDCNLESRAIADSLELPAVPILVAKIINDLEKVPRPFCLVLDDFHFVKERTIHNLVNLLIKHQPDHMHLVLISREEPLQGFLPALRAQNEIHELKTSELRFSAKEVQLFLEMGLNQPVDFRLAKHWQTQTEGWAAGLQLALYAFKKNRKAAFFSEDHLWDSVYVEQYLFSEVLAQLAPKERRFMEDLSILDRFESSLCDYMWETFATDNEQTTPGRVLLKSLISSNRFVIPLDDSQQWFRFHHLFRALLLKELSKHRTPDMIASLHARASEWLAERAFISQAIDHKLKARDTAGAVRLLEKERYSLLNQHQHHILARWLSMFPPESLEQQPELMMAQAWVYYFDGRYQGIPPLLDKIESVTVGPRETGAFGGEICLLSGAMAYWGGESRTSLDFIEKSLSLIPETMCFAQGLAEFYLSLAGLMNGDKKRVFKILYDQMQNQDLQPLRRFRLQLGLIFSHLLAGELVDLLKLGQQYLHLIADWNLPNLRAQTLYAMGRAHYQRNELALAIDCFLQADEIGYNLTENIHRDLLAALALGYQAAGDTESAYLQLDRLVDYVCSRPDPAPLTMVDSCRAHLELVARGFTRWQGLKEAAPNSVAAQPVWSNLVWVESPVTTECRRLSASDCHEDLVQAERKLAPMIELCRTLHNFDKQIELGALHAVVLFKLGKTTEASKTLERVVKLAEPGGYLRPFFELGQPVVEILSQLSHKTKAPDECSRLLAAFDNQKTRSEQPERFKEQADGSLDWREVLSTREYEILLCLEQRMRNQEIAERLYISPDTVKFHLKNIFRKLQASKRNQAILAAQKMGILPP